MYKPLLFRDSRACPTDPATNNKFSVLTVGVIIKFPFLFFIVPFYHGVTVFVTVSAELAVLSLAYEALLSLLIVF